MQYIQDDGLTHVKQQTVSPEMRYARRVFGMRVVLSILGLVVGYLTLFLNPFGLISAEYYLPLQYAFATICLAGAPVGLYLSVRKFVSRPQFWRSHCPCCEGHDLHRRPRTRMDRVFGLFLNLPLYRYKCDDCNWQGSRISHSQL